MTSFTLLILTITMQVSLLALMLLGSQFLLIRSNAKSSVRLMTLGSLLMIGVIGAAFLPLPSWLAGIEGIPSVAELDSTEPTQFATNERLAEETFQTNPNQHPISEVLPALIEEELASRQPEPNAPKAVENADRYFSENALPAWFSRQGLMRLTVFGLIGLSLIGLIRLATGYWALRRLRRNSQPIEDPKILELRDLICAKISCQKSAQIRSTPSLGTAATIGWRSPVVFVSDDFADWDDEQLESVLAHEIAHIHHNDFLKNLISQFCTAVHFFNPLVHLVANRLRLGQEVAADELAASFTQDRDSYARMLAGMALRQESKLNFAPMFLPCEKTFVRRIKMLTRKTDSKMAIPTWSFTGAIAITAIMVCGLRLPMIGQLYADESGSNGPIVAVAQEDDASLDHVGSESDFVNIVRPAKLLNNRNVKKLIEDLEPVKQFVEQQNKVYIDLVGVPLEEIDQITLCQTAPGGDDSSKFHNYTIIRTRKDNRKNFEDGADNIEGDILMRAGVGGGMDINLRGYIADDRTVIWAQTDEFIEYARRVNARDAKRADWYGNWEKVKGDGFVFMASETLIDEIASEALEPLSSQAGLPLDTGEIQEAISKANSLVLSGSYDSEINVKAFMAFANSAQAEQAESLIEEVVDVGKALLKPMVRQTEGLDKMAVEFLKSFVDGTKLSTKGSSLMMKSDFDIDFETIGSMAGEIQKAARRTQSANNIRQLVLAAHNYHSANGHFPPAVIKDESGHEHSWRIAVLPYIELGHIYNEYRFDEAWDSEHNSRVTAQVPDAFRHPEQDADDPYTSYLAIVGDNTVFGGEEGMRLEEIPDGTSRTVAFIEAKTLIHWASPQDLDADEIINGDIAGGFSEGGFNAAFCDGSVQFISNTVTKDTLEALLIINDGKVPTDW